jgi:hypothetical protein
MSKSGYIGVFSPAGKLVAYSTDRHLFREVVQKVEEILPHKAPDRASGMILDARRAALKELLGNDDAE